MQGERHGLLQTPWGATRYTALYSTTCYRLEELLRSFTNPVGHRTVLRWVRVFINWVALNHARVATPQKITGARRRRGSASRQEVMSASEYPGGKPPDCTLTRVESSLGPAAWNLITQGITASPGSRSGAAHGVRLLDRMFYSRV